MTTTQLTDTQRQVLEHAADQPDGCINWFPISVKGGARKKVIDGLINRCLITNAGTVEYHLTEEGYDSLGIDRHVLPTTPTDPEVEVALSAAEAGWVADAQQHAAPADHQPRIEGPTTGPSESDLANHLLATAEAALEQDDYVRGVQAAKEGAAIRTTTEATIAKLLARNSKQATVIQMLQSAEGATIKQIMEATGWQSHTIRGHFAGALKKKLGLNLTSDKTAGGERTYRI